MARAAGPYVQRLDGLDLTIEKATERTPDRSRYHVFEDGRLIESFRSLASAQELFRRLRDDRGWVPRERLDLDPEEQMRRQKEAQDRLDYLEYWGTSHKHRGGGKPRRRQR